MRIFRQGRTQKFVQRGLNFFCSKGGLHPLGPENPLETTDFTDQG